MQLRGRVAASCGKARSMLIVAGDRAECVRDFRIRRRSLIELLKAEGLSPTQAVTFGSMLGVIQVSARGLDFLGGGRWDGITTGIFAGAALRSWRCLLLMIGGGSHWMIAAFILLYGMGSGAFAVARATIPLVFYDRRRIHQGDLAHCVAAQSDLRGIAADSRRLADAVRQQRAAWPRNAVFVRCAADPALAQAPSSGHQGDGHGPDRLASLRNRLLTVRAGSDSVERQKILKIASASTACARKPTVKASVRNTGRPSV